MRRKERDDGWSWKNILMVALQFTAICVLWGNEMEFKQMQSFKLFISANISGMNSVLIQTKLLKYLANNSIVGKNLMWQ